MEGGGWNAEELFRLPGTREREWEGGRLELKRAPSPPHPPALRLCKSKSTWDKRGRRPLDPGGSLECRLAAHLCTCASAASLRGDPSVPSQRGRNLLTSSRAISPSEPRSQVCRSSLPRSLEFKKKSKAKQNKNKNFTM